MLKFTYISKTVYFSGLSTKEIANQKNQLKKQIFFFFEKAKNFFVYFSPNILLHRFGFNSHEIVLIKAIWLSNFRKFQFIAFFFSLSILCKDLTVCVSVNYWINDFCIENSMETVDSETCLSITDIENAQRSSRKPFVICIFVLFFLLFFKLLDVSTTPRGRISKLERKMK